MTRSLRPRGVLAVNGKRCQVQLLLSTMRASLVMNAFGETTDARTRSPQKARGRSKRMFARRQSRPTLCSQPLVAYFEASFEASSEVSVSVFRIFFVNVDVDATDVLVRVAQRLGVAHRQPRIERKPTRAEHRDGAQHR